MLSNGLLLQVINGKVFVGYGFGCKSSQTGPIGTLTCTGGAWNARAAFGFGIQHILALICMLVGTSLI